MLPEKVGFHRTQEAVCSCPLPAPLQTVRKSRASDFGSPSRTNRGAIRPHHNRNETDVRKDFTNHKTSSFPILRAKHAPFFAYPAWEQDMQKILGSSTEAQDFLTVLRSRWQRTGANHLWLLAE